MDIFTSLLAPLLELDNEDVSLDMLTLTLEELEEVTPDFTLVSFLLVEPIVTDWLLLGEVPEFLLELTSTVVLVWSAFTTLVRTDPFSGMSMFWPLTTRLTSGSGCISLAGICSMLSVEVLIAAAEPDSSTDSDIMFVEPSSLAPFAEVETCASPNISADAPAPKRYVRLLTLWGTALVPNLRIIFRWFNSISTSSSYFD
jgi:hypothetical protein